MKLKLPTIAVINDDPDYLEMMKEMLTEERECHVVIGEKGEDALHVIKTSSPDLVILDLVFGGESKGLQILEAMRNDATLREVPVILCTADEQFLDTNGSKLTDLNSTWINKPFDLDDLLEKIDASLGKLPA